MSQAGIPLRVGTRSSPLARVQTRGVLDRLARLFPGLRFEEVCLSSPGDRDLATDLRDSPADFFTRDLDEKVLGGDLDFAVHSAKDLPDPVPAGLGWCWLPWREDPRDVLVRPRGRGMDSMPPDGVIGVSSPRREAYCRQRFPRARLTGIRGTIEQRLSQMDEGHYDLLVMAGAALIRLGLLDRVTEWIPGDQLAAPDGQGFLALTFRAGDPRLERIRSLFVFAADDDAPARLPGSAPHGSALAGRRVLLTASDALLDRAAQRVSGYGGVPLRFPLIRLCATDEGLDRIQRAYRYDWLVLTSPSAVRCFGERLLRAGVDLKSLPTLVSCGRGTSRALGEIGLRAGIAAERDFGAEGLLAAAEAKLTPGLRVLRLRSDKAGPALAQALAARGAVVDDCILYRNEPIQHDALPGFDAVLFASGSAVESFETQWGLEPPLRGKLVAAIGEPTSAALRGRGRAPDVVGPEATVDATLEALAARYVGLALEGDGR